MRIGCRARNFTTARIVIHALMHIPSDEITLDTAKRYIAGVVDAQSELPGPDWRRLDECVNRTNVMHLNLFFRRPQS